ncbi:hypothetical protein BDW62DRAFT_32483 [Aspergillus aurantiobrunneus]
MFLKATILSLLASSATVLAQDILCESSPAPVSDVEDCISSLTANGSQDCSTGGVLCESGDAQIIGSTPSTSSPITCGVIASAAQSVLNSCTDGDSVSGSVSGDGVVVMVSA